MLIFSFAATQIFPFDTQKSETVIILTINSEILEVILFVVTQDKVFSLVL